MYARRVSMKLEANKSADFTKRLEGEVIPLLRKQPGFRDEIAFVGADGTGAFAISLWDRKEDADAYAKNVAVQADELMASVIHGKTLVEGYEVSTSTFGQSPMAEPVLVAKKK